jgi:4a-hydroxytetrahydrobiopterin dehydratase
MNPAQIQELLGELQGEWEVNARGHLERLYVFENFVQAMELANRVGEIAEAQNHHPDLYIAWGKCRVEIWTHSVGGLTPSDFYLAAKAERVWGELIR